MASAKSIAPKTEIAEIDRTLREYQKTEALNLSEKAIRSIRSEINRDQTRIEVIEHRDGTVRLKATEHVGVVSIPDGPTIEIRAKARGANLLALLQYAHGVEATTIEQPTTLSTGRTFVEAIASLFSSELESALNKGFHRSYRRENEAVDQLRGRINVQQQLQRQGPTPTKFECSYDELTADTIVNRAVLYASVLLTQLVRDRGLSQALDRHQQLLRRRVSLTPVRPVDLEGIELNRLASHYTDLLRFTKLILRSVFLEELRTGSRSSFALLVNMNEVFELAVERAVREALSDRFGWTVKGQASSQSLVTGGKRTITIQPDVLVRDEDGKVALVGDAKWKLDEPRDGNREPSNADIYQMVAYELAHGVPGMLFYPAQHNQVRSEYSVTNLYPLRTVEVPISVSEADSRTLPETIRDVVTSEVDSLLRGRNTGGN